MTQVVQFIIIGLASGALYVLIGFGLVITNRASGVVNFSHAAIGMFGTFVFWTLNQNHRLPYGLAAAIGVVTSAVLAGIVQQAMRPLRSAAPVTRMVATLGVLTVVEQAAQHIWTSNTLLLPSELPTRSVRVLGANIGENQLWIFGIVALLTLALGLLTRYTRFGHATLASAENARAVSALGYSPDRLALWNWMIAGALAGIAGILLAPIIQLQVSNYTLLILPALAAAVVGRLSSLPLTFVGGLFIGVMQSELTRYASQGGWSTASPFLLVAVLLVVRGTDRSFRSRVAERLPSVGSGRVNWRVVVPVVALAVLFVESVGPDWSGAVATTLIGGLVILSVVVVTGYSGQLSLAQYAFAGWSAWVAAQFASHFNLPFLLSIVVGVALTIPLGLVVGLVTLRTRGAYLAIASLGLATALNDLVFNNASLTGSTQGLSVPNASVGGLDVSFITHPNRYALVVLVVFVLFALAVANLRRGRSGRRLLAVRANDRAAASLGIGTVAARLYAFVVASAIAAAAGVLLGFENQNVLFSGYTALQSIEVVPQAVVGGVGWIAGAINGGLLQPASVTGILLNKLGTTWSTYLTVIGGILVIAIVLRAQDGIAAHQWEQNGRLRERLGIPRREPKQVSLVAEEVRAVDPLTLGVTGVTVRFGSTVVLDDVSLSVEPGSVIGLIGPNGAGKTTLIDVVTGYVRPRRGGVTVNGREITHRSPSQVARAGITRSFQSLELFEDMSVLDNLRVASEPRDALSYVRDLVWPVAAPMTASAGAAIRNFGLTAVLDKRPQEISYGVRRLVGIARAVATGASVLLLDEPAAGLNDTEARELGALVRSLAQDLGVGILLIEHNVDLIMAYCDEVYVLNFGSIVAHGAPETVREDPVVVAAYLGAPSASPADSLDATSLPSSTTPA